MAKIQPFKAIRPVRDKVHLVATRPVYSYKKNVLKAKLEDNPFTFLHIINPEFGQEKKSPINSPERFALVSERYADFLQKKILIQESAPSIYVYKQTKGKHEFLGVIAGASAAEYQTGKIKKHEATLTKREEMFTNYLDIVGYNAEPVLLSHSKNEKVEEKLQHICQARPEYEFTTTDRIKHELWVLSENDTKEIQVLFQEIPELYIADGHHRSASSTRLLEKRKAENRQKNANETSFLSFIIAEDKLNIVEFNRLIKSLNKLPKEELLDKIKQHFTIESCANHSLPKKEHQFTICLQGDWYKLECLPEIVAKSHPVNSLDSKILTDYLLRPFLGISDLKTDANIDFVSGTEPISKIEKRMRKGEVELAVFLYPVSMQQVKTVADNELTMPPKSTWVEPKLRSGLTIYNVNE